MASSSGPSGASVPGGLDVAWKYARPIEGNKHGTICTFCESTFKSGGITRLKYHLAGFDPHKSVKKCKEVPPDIKKEVIAWIKEKESSKQHKKSVEENIRSTAREGYMGNKSSNPVDDDDDNDDDGYAYPPDMHPAEKEDYLAAIRESKQERFRQGGVYGMGSKRFAGGASGSSQPQYRRTQSLRDPLPSPPVPMPHKNTRAKQRKIKGMIRNSAEVLGRYCSKFFILENVAPQKASSPLFKNMIAAAQQAGQGVATPSPYEIKHKYLDMEHTDMQAYVEKVKEDWGVCGCTIMSDGWTGPTRLSIINFMDVIKEVGPSNVVHIVTDNGSAFVKAGQMMMERYPIYWTPCAAHCIDLIFEDIGKQESVANVINNARKLTNYIYNHSWLLAQMRIFCQGDLVRPGATRFATNYITINSILNKKAGLKQLFTSEEWYNSRFSESEEGKRIESRVLDHRFWDAMEGVQSIYEPLYSILRIVDTEVVPAMPILYDMFHIMKEKISKLKEKKWLLKIINHRWDVTLSRPLHQAAHYLNPRYQYETGVGHNKELLSGLQRVFERLNPTGDRGLQAFGAEVINFRDCRKTFRTEMAVKSRKSIPPAEWWNLHGDSAPNLQKIAMRILSQTASSSACKRNWSTFALIHMKQRNRLAYTRLEKIVFCYYNMKLKLRDEEAKMNKVAENDYIDLLDIARQPSDDDNNPIQQWIMTAHLDDEQGNPDAVIAQHAAQEGVDVDRFISEDVRSGDTSSFERDMLGPRQCQRRPLRDYASASRMESSSNSSDNDGGSNAGSGGNEEGRQYSPFTVEADFTHATQDEDHGCREAGPGIGAIGKQYSKKRSQPINPSEEDMAISFGSMSIGTRPSTNSNESYDGYGYVMSDYSGTRYGAQDEETDYGPTSWVNPNYPIYGMTVGSSRETYVHHVQTWLTNYSGYMTWYDYCMNLDGCSSLFEPHRSSSFM
ncbi:unnamed protein product [Prunus armeniaca]